MSSRDRLLLIVIMMVFAALSASYSLVTRFKWGPDEPAHFIYVRSIATRFELPPISHTAVGTENSRATHEGMQPVLYYALMAIPYAVMNAAGASSDTIWRVLRLLNVPLGLLWVCGVYALCREFFGGNGRALAATAFTALIPTACYTFGMVNNENLITPLFTWTLLPILVFFKKGEMTSRDAVILGLLMGLSLLTKAQGLMLVGLFVLAAFLVCRRSGYANWKPVLRGAGLALAVAVVVAGWWFVRNVAVHGELMPRSLRTAFLGSGLVDAFAQPGTVLQAVSLFSGLTYGYFWTPFWLCQHVVTWSRYFAVLCALTVVGLVGLLVAIRRRTDIDKRSLGLLMAAPLIAYLSWMRYALMVDWGTIMQGRLFLCTAVVVGIMWATAVDGVARRPWLRATLYAAGLVFMLLANAGVLYCDVTFHPAVTRLPD